MSEIRSNSKSLLGYGDLVKVHASQNLNASQFIARALGLRFEAQPDSSSSTPKLSVGEFEPVTEASNPITPLPPNSTGYPANIEDIAIWIPTHFTARSEAPVAVEISEFQTQQEHWDGVWWRNQPASLPFSPLAPWSVLKGRIEKLTQDRQRTRTVDAAKLVSKIASGQLVLRVPRAEKLRPEQLLLVQDRSQRLTPFHEDYEFIQAQRKREWPNAPTQTLSFKTSDQGPVDRLYLDLPSGTSSVLICGDLGLLAKELSLRSAWLEWGRRTSAMGFRLSALVPFAIGRAPNRFRETFRIESMQADPNAQIDSETEFQQVLQTLFVLTSSSSSISPRLLRALRRLLPLAIDASLESAYWQDSRLISRHCEGATIQQDVVRQELTPLFEGLDQGLQRSALGLIREYHAEMHPSMWLQLLFSLSPKLQLLLPPSDREDAIAAIQRINDLRKSNDYQGQEMECFMDRCLDRFTEHATTDQVVGTIIHQAWADLRPAEESKLAFRDPIDLPKLDEFRCKVSADESKVILERHSAKESAELQGQYLLRSSTEAIRIECLQRTVLTEASFWKHGKKPSFVSDFGCDEYGAWFEFQVPKRNEDGVVTQRMRWIRPGTFMMGSPEDEPERSSNEVLHKVTLSRGFWMADTACTQALWQAVMGNNQCYFQGQSRPVEQVNYEDVAEFCTALSNQLPGLMPQLPTEAQWEYACRAATQSPFSFGTSISTDQANFDGCHPYDNAPKGIDRHEPLNVKDLPANAWGLYQMHGNVWEWCEDWYTERLTGSQIDPVGPNTGSNRVVRGGSWIVIARNVRSACRDWFVPGHRSRYLGFRLLSSASAEPSEMAEGLVAEQGMEPDRIGASEEISREYRVRVAETQPTQVEIENATKIRVVSNLEIVELQKLTNPEWAVEFGRDVYGVYGDFEIESTKDGSIVQQRLRWIPPGSFQMGSPPDEPGRFENENLHPVAISNGFWMFDAPCSQKLWMAIMDKNPSHFPDPDRPVESVDWEQSREFAQRLSQRLNNLSFALPTEAQWEYACRAGTTTAIFSGPLEIIGIANAPALDPIAWYGGNSGHKYDSDSKPHDVRSLVWLSNKQYSFTHAGTRKIRMKAPNRWGLYDMLGNVREWCADWYSDYSVDVTIDPIGPESGSWRVVRGGSWINDARIVRSACRYWNAPPNRSDDMGFRLLSSVSAGPVAERVSGSRRIPKD